MEISLPSKEECQNVHSKIMMHLMKDLESNMKKHMGLNHTYFIHNTVHTLCRELVLNKQVVVFLLLGSNTRKTEWGNLKDKYDMEPIKYALRSEIVKTGSKLYPNLYFKVFFTDLHSNGDFRIKIEFSEKTKNTNTWVKVVNKRFPNKKETNTVEELKKQVAELNAKIAKLE